MAKDYPWHRVEGGDPAAAGGYGLINRKHMFYGYLYILMFRDVFKDVVSFCCIVY